ncbi:fluoride efflux transporter CrcB [Gloeocapsa sp. PCC 73106]|uniref:fluoride efflux transporter CrcB n=1 Tax=Gloeocapsa sp. PCC 73106 TaxID=102232 RepID=UPI0002ACCD59|nr:fluoride efflux transporter CrcB [Gloeocapsa sp. PCC 73106]ELR96213.1 crcB protein [Gloeocapsa sp. PCC 73106]
MRFWQLLAVFLGGGLGSLGRYYLSLLITRKVETIFPLGTFTVNLVGCFLIGVFTEILIKYSPQPWLALLFITGFCGGFTTFSSFSLENNLLLKNSEYLISAVYTLMSIFWGFAFTFLGIYLVRKC